MNAQQTSPVIVSAHVAPRPREKRAYYKGNPINYRALGVPSIQVSIALDKRRADIDVDYRSSSFSVGLFNGHLTASNSDVRAGNNDDRHLNQWTGFQNWWRGFFGVRNERASILGLPDEGTRRPESRPVPQQTGKRWMRY